MLLLFPVPYVGKVWHKYCVRISCWQPCLLNQIVTLVEEGIDILVCGSQCLAQSWKHGHCLINEFIGQCMCSLRTLLLPWKRRKGVIHVPHGPNVSLVNIQKKQEENNRTRMALEHRSGSCLHCVLLATFNFTFCFKDSWILDHHLAKASRLTKEFHIPWTYFSFPSLKDLSFFHSLFHTALLVSPFFWTHDQPFIFT